jgi:DNA invertase Pin-like site-specific DNA recombinase
VRAAIYLRISQDRTGESLGVERRREDCTKLVADRGWTLARPPFVENDTSAAGRKPRPQFRALLAAVEAGDIGVIVAWALDRLTRTARDRLALVETCRDHGVRIALVRGSDMDPTTPSGRLAIGILGEVAQHEIDAKSDRQARAAEQAAVQGRWIGGAVRSAMPLTG